MNESRLHIAVGAEDSLKALEELRGQVERGECTCFAVRLFKPDGSWEDVAAGGTEEEQEAALADLRRAYSNAN